MDFRGYVIPKFTWMKPRIGNHTLYDYNFYFIVEQAAEIAHRACFANAGQCCVAGTRTYVQSGIYDKFVAKAAEIAKNRKVGNSWEDVQQGPQVGTKNKTSHRLDSCYILVSDIYHTSYRQLEQTVCGLGLAQQISIGTSAYNSRI